jgi:hypothetical protein
MNAGTAINGYFNPLSGQSVTADAFPCPACGVLIWTGHDHECGGQIKGNPVNVTIRPSPHEHVWTIGHVATEAVTYPGSVVGVWAQVVYLFCQCGATKRSIPE